jgi:hypothetical protein
MGVAMSEEIRRLGLLSVLLRMREDALRGRIGMYIGEANIHRFAGFVDGYRYCCASRGEPDVEFTRFCEWLRVEKEEFPPEGWESKYMRDCDGDQLAAIMRFLDFVAEFVGR